MLGRRGPNVAVPEAGTKSLPAVAVPGTVAQSTDTGVVSGGVSRVSGMTRSVPESYSVTVVSPTLTMEGTQGAKAWIAPRSLSATAWKAASGSSSVPRVSASEPAPPGVNAQESVQVSQAASSQRASRTFWFFGRTNQGLPSAPTASGAIVASWNRLGTDTSLVNDVHAASAQWRSR